MSDKIEIGSEVPMEVAGQILIIEPVPYGNIKKLLKMGLMLASELADGKNILEKLPEMLEEKLPQFIPLLFKKGTHEFLTPEWIDDNLTIIHMRKIMETAIKVNGLEDFFAKMGVGIVREKVEPRPEREPEAVLQNSGSTTS